MSNQTWIFIALAVTVRSVPLETLVSSKGDSWSELFVPIQKAIEGLNFSFLSVVELTDDYRSFYVSSNDGSNSKHVAKVRVDYKNGLKGCNVFTHLHLQYPKKFGSLKSLNLIYENREITLSSQKKAISGFCIMISEQVEQDLLEPLTQKEFMIEDKKDRCKKFQSIYSDIFNQIKVIVEEGRWLTSGKPSDISIVRKGEYAFPKFNNLDNAFTLSFTLYNLKKEFVQAILVKQSVDLLSLIDKINHINKGCVADDSNYIARKNQFRAYFYQKANIPSQKPNMLII
jgi:hypothetical protein